MPLLLRQLQEVVLDFFFPRHCVGCGKMGSFLCDRCVQALPRLLPPFCQRCGKQESSGGYCSSCWGGQVAVDGIRSPFRFEGAIRQAIHELKYHNLRAICPDLAQLLLVYLQANPVPGNVLVPVPMHPLRLKRRGYNQSALLARELAKLTGLTLVDDCLLRSRNSLPQARTDSVEKRRSNVANAFSCRNDKLSGKCVMLIDDVCTSGATLEACAMALKAAGAKSVWGLTLAREI